jgi:hypothetical protein
MGWVADTLNALDKPSNALQGYLVGAKRNKSGLSSGLKGMVRGWNQEENYDLEQLWGEDLQKKGWSDREGFGETASYIGSTALNLITDPLNFVGVGMFKKGAKAAGELKGALTSGNPNIITDYYGPMGKTEEAMKVAERFGKEAGFSKKEIERLKTGAALKGNVKGKGEALGTGMLNAMKMQLPSNRALYRDTGINKPLFESATRAQGSHAMNDREMIGRAIFNKWINKQKGKTGETKALDDIVSRAVYVDEVGDVTRPLEKGFFGYANARAMGDQAKNLTKDEILEVERSVMNTWKQKSGMDVMMDIGKKGINKVSNWVGLDDVKLQMSTGKALQYGKGDLVTVKRPASKKTGNHWNDFNHSKQMNAVAKQVFDVDNLPKSVDELYERMSKVQFEDVEGLTRKKVMKNLTSIKKDTDGVWFTFSRPGSAVVEGGVNFRSKLKLDGDGFTVMSDEHNLAEALTSASKLNRLITVSPPMHFNILKIKPKQTRLSNMDNPPPFPESVPRTYPDAGWTELRKGGSRGRGNKGELISEGRPDVKKFLMEQQASTKTLREERMAMARKMLGGVTLSRGMFTND